MELNIKHSARFCVKETKSHDPGPLGTYNMFENIVKQCRRQQKQTAQTGSVIQFREIKTSRTKPVQEVRTENFSPHTPKRGKIEYVVKLLKSQESVGNQKSFELRFAIVRSVGYSEMALIISLSAEYKWKIL